jgi:hypothetical protein
MHAEPGTLRRRRRKILPIQQRHRSNLLTEPTYTHVNTGFPTEPRHAITIGR